MAATVCAWDRSDLTHTDLKWELVVAFAIVAAPLSLILKASEYPLTARIADQLPSWRNALEVAVVASAANLLPLPGSVLVIVKTLASDGSGYRQAIGASAVPAIASLGVTGVIGGVAITAAGPVTLGLVVLLAGTAALAGAALMLHRTAAPNDRVILATTTFVVEVAWLAASGPLHPSCGDVRH